MNNWVLLPPPVFYDGKRMASLDGYAKDKSIFFLLYLPSSSPRYSDHLSFSFVRSFNRTPLLFYYTFILLGQVKPIISSTADDLI